jgi:hypothetical protein
MTNEDKKVRTIRLTHSMNARLEALCEHLGTNPNAFLITKIGEIVSTSEITFKSQQSQSAMVDILAQFANSASEDIEEIKQQVEQQLSLEQDFD